MKTIVMIPLLVVAAHRPATAAPIDLPPSGANSDLTSTAPPTANVPKTPPVQDPFYDHTALGTAPVKESLTAQDVKEAQRALSANGFAVKQDGIAGPATEAAVRAFQRQNGLTPSGELNAATLQQLNSAIQSIPPPTSRAADQPTTF